MNHRDKDMKTMTEEECRSFVLSGFIPTSNDEVADIQDCFLRHNILFLTGLLLDAETEEKARRLYGACLFNAREMEEYEQRAQKIREMMSKRTQYIEHLDYLKTQISAIEMYLAQTDGQAKIYGDFFK